MPEPKPQNLNPRSFWKKLTSTSFNQLNIPTQTHLIVEDFKIVSNIGLVLKDNFGKILEEEEIDKENGGFCHFIRTEREFITSKTKLKLNRNFY